MKGSAAKTRALRAAGPGDVVASGRRVSREAWAAVCDLSLRMRAIIVDAAASVDLTPMQAFALRRLEPGEGAPMTALAEWLVCDASNVTGIVDKLEARGLVERRTSPHDRRVKLLALTALGVTTRQQFLERLYDPPEAMTTLPLEERRRLASTLVALMERLPAENAGTAPAQRSGSPSSTSR